MEFEVPARALLSQGGSFGRGYLAPHEAPWFDLAATRPRGTAGLPASMRMTIRAVTRPFGAREGLTLRLGLPEQPWLTLTGTPGVLAQGLVLIRTGGTLALYAQGVAGLERCESGWEANDMEPGDGFTLSLATDAAEPIWCDVSLLHSSRPGADPYPQVDFDWFFGAPDTDPLAQAVAPDSLAALPEAQARILGVTRPLRLATS